MHFKFHIAVDVKPRYCILVSKIKCVLHILNCSQDEGFLFPFLQYLAAIKIQNSLFVPQEKAAELLRVYRSSEFSSCSIVSFQDLCTLSSNICADESTLCMALLQLQRDKQVMVSLHEGEKVSLPTINSLHI